MTKKELIDAVAEATAGTADAPLTKGNIAAVLDGLTDVVTRTLANGDGAEVRIEPLGRLYTDRRAARQGMNPATGEKVTYPAKNVVKFKPAKPLREAVEG